MKLKFWDHFSQAVYQPLMKLKNIDILDFNFRCDYKQVLSVQEKENDNIFSECISQNFIEIGRQ
jgi:hypothetical protein